MKWHVRRLVSSCSAAALTLAALLPQATWAKTVELKPSSPWEMKWDDDSCVLKRAFGEGPEILVLQFERFGPSSGFQLSMVGPQLARLQQTTALSIEYGGASPRKERASFLMGQFKPDDGSKAMQSFFANSAIVEWKKTNKEDSANLIVTPEMEAAVTSVGVSWPGTSITLKTGALDKPFAAMRKCTDDLVRAWGLDPAVQATLSHTVEPLSSAGLWLKSADYPLAMRVKGKQALVNFRLIIDAQGKPTSCAIQRSYNDKLFDEITCAKMMLRARFKPALDAAGKPVPSYYRNTAKWTMS